MKKKFDLWVLPHPTLKKLIMELKIAILFIVVSVSSVFATTTYSQVAKVSLDMNNVRLEQVMDEIERQSEFYFIFNQKQIDIERVVNIQDENKLITDILPELFKGTNVNYVVLDRKILLTTDPIEDKILNINSEIKPQQVQINGKISDETGNALPGVNIKVEGTSIGVISDIGGLYSILVPNTNSVLIFSFIGYKAQTISISGKTVLDVLLVPELMNLDEVVVIGYGTQKKIEVTSAVANVKSENFIKGSIKDAGQLLQGKVAGLSVSTTSGDPTASSQILLRGTATLYTSTQPLILIDGIPGDLNSVAPNDIESMDVLKDGSAAAIYGTRGTNGVILINTKKATSSSTPVINYDGYVSTQEFIRMPKIFSAQEYRQKISEGIGFTDQGASTDWVKEISRATPINQNHNFSISGANGNTNYYGTINYRDQQGVVLSSDYKTINTRLGLNQSMFNNKLNINFGLISNENNSGVDYGSSSTLGIGDSTPSDLFNQALIRNPTEPIMNQDGSWYENTILYSVNPLGLIRETFGGSKTVSTRINGSVTFEPIKDLHLKANGYRGQFDYQQAQGNTKQHVSNTKGGTKNGVAYKDYSKNTDNLLELTADYTKKFDSHKITALAGYSYQDNLNESSSMYNFDFPAGNFSYLDNIGLGNAILRGEGAISSSKYESNLIGFFGRLNYNYKEKYLLMASLRYEASSKLAGTNNPWGLFPSISAGWRISEEDFMKDAGFSNLKLRAGYGVTGTAPDPYFLGVALLGYQSPAWYQNGVFYNGTWVQTLSPVSNPNPYLRWEEKKETNIGLDFGILKGRLNGSIDLYRRTTDGLLYDYSVPVPPNAYGTTTANVGVMRNNGLEILLTGTPVQAKKFSWSSTATFSTNTNKLVSLSNELYQTTQDWFNTGDPTGGALNTETYTHRVEVGQTIGNFYGHKVIDISNDGKWIYEDKDGNPTQDRLEENKKIIGNGLPKYYASWNNTLRYGNFDFYINIRGAFGFDVLNFQRMAMENPNVRLGNNQMRSAYDKVFGKAVLSSGNMAEYNSYYLEKGNFVKIDNISIGYNFKSVKYIHASRVYFAVLNGIIITGYKGMDPEVPTLGLAPGNDYGNKYPTTRVYSVGWSITFN
jgi:TonB-dependent starch-binding outer membrane protein SusC